MCFQKIYGGNDKPSQPKVTRLAIERRLCSATGRELGASVHANHVMYYRFRALLGSDIDIGHLSAVLALYQNLVMSL
jgi:hypothetical protein